jgi:hypothetical protein
VHVPDLVGLLDAWKSRDSRAVRADRLPQPDGCTSAASAAIGEDLPRGTTVVLWGVDDLTWQQIDRDRSPGAAGCAASSEATSDDVWLTLLDAPGKPTQRRSVT